MNLQTAVTHYFATWKARQELRYVALVDKKEGMDRTVAYWKERHAQEMDGPTLLTWVAVLGGLFLHFLCAFVPVPFLGPLQWVHSLTIFLFRTQKMVRIVFYIAILIHVVDGTYAWILARKVDPLNATSWFWQSLALGYFSLNYLLKRAKKRTSKKQQ